MFCPSCGKSISDESKFCMHCGKSVAASQSKKRATIPSDKMPAYIKKLAYWPNDIYDNKQHFGFGISFMLLDEALRPTRYDGKLRIYVGGQTYTDFDKTIQIKKDDFRESTKDPNWYGCTRSQGKLI